MSLHRYGIYSDDSGCWVDSNSDGPYVLYEDAMEEINKLKKQLELLRLAVR